MYDLQLRFKIEHPIDGDMNMGGSINQPDGLYKVQIGKVITVKMLVN